MNKKRTTIKLVKMPDGSIRGLHNDFPCEGGPALNPNRQFKRRKEKRATMIKEAYEAGQQAAFNKIGALHPKAKEALLHARDAGIGATILAPIGGLVDPWIEKKLEKDPERKKRRDSALIKNPWVGGGLVGAAVGAGSRLIYKR